MMIATPYKLFIRRELPSKQTIVLTLVSLLPCVILVITMFFGGQRQFMERVGANMIFEGVLVLVPIFYSVAAFHEEFEQRTVVYLLTRPPSRTNYVIAKFLTAWTCVAFSVTTAIVAMTALSMFGSWEYSGYYVSLGSKLLVTSLLGGAAYTSIYIFFGLVARNPVILSLIVSFIWEWCAGNIPGKLQLYTVGVYTRSLFAHLGDVDPQYLFPDGSQDGTPTIAPSGLGNLTTAAKKMLYEERELPGPLVSATVLAGVTVAFVFLSIRAFRAREDA